MSRTRKVCFACIGTEAKRRLDRRFRQRQTRRRTVETKVVKLIMNPRELAIRLEKRWVVRDGLIQQIGGLAADSLSR